VRLRSCSGRAAAVRVRCYAPRLRLCERRPRRPSFVGLWPSPRRLRPLRECRRRRPIRRAGLHPGQERRRREHGAAAHAGVARSSGSLLLRFCDWRERHPGAAARSSGSASVERCPSGQRWRQPLFQHHGQFSPILGQDQLFQKPAPGRNKATAAPEKPSPNILG
jgi:hypothetical protein